MAIIKNRKFLDSILKRFVQMGVDWLNLVYEQGDISTEPHSKEGKIIQKVLNNQLEKMKRSPYETAHYTKMLMLTQQILIPLVDNDNFYQINVRETMINLAQEVNNTAW